MRTRFLSKCTNQEVEQYLASNDIIIVPVGVTELHGGLPLDSETVLAEGIALKMAEACDGLILHNLPYFYAGSTIRGRGTVQVNVEPSIQYLKEVTKSLIRQGFKRIIFTSFHGPAHLYISPVVRDIFEDYHVPVLYIDPLQAIGMEKLFQGASSEDPFTEIILAAYDSLGRLGEVPLTTPENDFWNERKPSTTAFANKINGMAYASGAIGMIFGDHMDHMPTIQLTSEEQKQALADSGHQQINQIVDYLDMVEVVGQMQQVAQFVAEQAKKYQWTNNI
ncbi:creatininase family protein [Aerococcus urinaeequi]|uniref:Creatinine amidohydrolase n=1 Tax=Aerococcus viridans TaxID=1377 RepID=A0A2N6UDX0_9LACT|nr:creatininase family protein [Aerococcus viridans]PMC79762.1 creatinine amidohydrolase [Aerococcus viridans]